MSAFDNSGDGLLDSLANYASTGANIYNTVTGRGTTTPAPAAAPAKKNWLLIGGAVAAVVIVLLLVTRK